MVRLFHLLLRMVRARAAHARQEMHLTRAQIGNLTIAWPLIGALCDRIGPRRAYTWLLITGSLPVVAVGLAHGYTRFRAFRLAIGALGASFVITQYRMSVMFAPNIVGTANAAVAGWGNLGGGLTQIAMPLLFALRELARRDDRCVNRKALGAVAGIVGAGGNVGAMLAVFSLPALNTGPVLPRCYRLRRFPAFASRPLLRRRRNR